MRIPPPGHDVGNAGIAHINAGIEDPAQVTVGKNTDDVHIVIADSGHA